MKVSPIKNKSKGLAGKDDPENGPRLNNTDQDKIGLNMSSVTSQKDIADCISCWLAYLQMLSGLCNAGSRLSHCLCVLSQENHLMAAHCQAMWEELVRASTVASSNIKSNVLTALQELSLSDVDSDKPKMSDTNQVVGKSLAALIQIQYQMSLACCECLGPVLGCPCPQDHDADCSAEAIQNCFQRFFPPPNRSPVPVSVTPVVTVSQRRWSEAAAQENNSNDNGTMRRWSMPWETSKINEQQAAWPGSRLVPKNKLTVPGATSQDRSRSSTPESAWHSSMASQEELQEVIQLLSCPLPPGQKSQQVCKPPSLPGVILTGCGFDAGHGEAWSESTTPGSRRGSASPNRTSSWHTGHMWNEGDGQASCVDGIQELCPTSLDPATIASRKSSSSTDSSSSYSLHSRSTPGSLSAGSGSDGPQEARGHMYSMWSGAELPFIKLSESAEVEESSSQSSHHHFFAHRPT